MDLYVIFLKTVEHYWYCSICDITFRNEKLYLGHELHSHKTKEITVIDLKNLCCDICNKRYTTPYAYRRHMADRNNIDVPRTEPGLSKAPDINNPNNYCASCNLTHSTRSNYHTLLVNVHHLPPPKRHSKLLRKPKHMKLTIDILNLYCEVCTTTYLSKLKYMQYLI